MIKQLAIAAVASAAIASYSTAASAAQVTWDFANTSPTSTTGGTNLGNSMIFTSGGQQVRVTAFSLDNSNPSSVFEDASIRRFTGAGLGVCNQGEVSNCSSPQHQVDNDGRYDFVLFEFISSPGNTDPLRYTIQTFSGDDIDTSYWVGDGSLPMDLAGFTVGQLTSLLGFDNEDETTNDNTIDVDGDTTATVLLVGARYTDGGSDEDAFKILSLKAEYTTRDVSEPGTLAAFGIGLAALGYLGRRRRAA